MTQLPDIVQVASYINPVWKLSPDWTKYALDHDNRTMNGSKANICTTAKRLTYPMVPVFPIIRVSYQMTKIKYNSVDLNLEKDNLRYINVRDHAGARARHYIHWWYNAKSARHGRYMLVKVGLLDKRQKNHGAHANWIIIDKVDHVAVRVESHGESPMYNAPFDKKIKQFLQLSCAPSPVQYVANRTERFIRAVQYQNKLCASWTVYCALEALRKHHDRRRCQRSVCGVQRCRRTTPHFLDARKVVAIRDHGHRDVHHC